MSALIHLARRRGCYGMFVFVDQDNRAALATYVSAGATNDGPQVMLSWAWPQ